MSDFKTEGIKEYIPQDYSDKALINKIELVKGMLGKNVELIKENDQKLTKEFDDTTLPTILLFGTLIEINRHMVEELKLMNQQLKEILELKRKEGMGEDNGKPSRIKSNK